MRDRSRSPLRNPRDSEDAGTLRQTQQSTSNQRSTLEKVATKQMDDSAENSITHRQKGDSSTKDRKSRAKSLSAKDLMDHDCPRANHPNDREGERVDDARPNQTCA